MSESVIPGKLNQADLAEEPEVIDPELQKDGLVPGWAEVAKEFKLDGLHPRDLRLFENYYRAQRKIAQGQQKRGARAIRGMLKNPDFQALEKEKDTLLFRMARFIRGPSEKGKGKVRQTI